MSFSYFPVDSKESITKLSLSLKPTKKDQQLLKENNTIKNNHSEDQIFDVNLNDNKEIVFKENKPIKRRLSRTYQRTLEHAKKLKTNSDNIVEQGHTKAEHRSKQCFNSTMLNGHIPNNNPQNGTKINKNTIVSLANLGNTCFLNSILYTLRFAPRFLHNLHHLVSDLASVDQRLSNIREKSSSLGRGSVSLISSSPRSWSSKDLSSLAHDVPEAKTAIQVATERLHETYSNMFMAEVKSSTSASGNDDKPEPYAAESFLSALRELNSTFEGNTQQDAHELLMCMLDCIRETCQALRTRHSSLNMLHHTQSDALIQTSDKGLKFGNLRKSWKKRRKSRVDKSDEAEVMPPPSADALPGWDFVAENFEGVTVLKTKCLECETITERKQSMYDICIPISDDSDVEIDEQDPFRVFSVATEYLRDQNKYWCERCLRYNEACCSVSYAQLPRLLILQLKRFSGGMEKITSYHPTPLELDCFCDKCSSQPDEPLHRYSLWAVVVHMGTLSGGHYTTYVYGGGGEGGTTCKRRGGGADTTAAPRGLMRLLKANRVCADHCTHVACCAVLHAPLWLHCDDEDIKPITRKELEDVLSRRTTAATPYLLFYSMNDVG